MDLIAVILAAGQGRRMNSALPKALHPVGGQPMLTHVLRATSSLHPTSSIIVHATDAIPALQQAVLDANAITWVEQPVPKGTGHAVACALAHLPKDGRVLVLHGDVPLVEPAALARLVESTPEDAVGVMTVRASDPTGLGRIIRDEANNIQRIVEHKDATQPQRAITEVNTGIFCLRISDCSRWLPQLACDNAQGEYYLTDIISLAVAEKLRVVGLCVDDEEQFLGVNNRRQWMAVEQVYQRRQAWSLIDQGVWVADPNRLTLRGTVKAAAGVQLDVGVVLEGDVVLEAGAIIGPYAHLKNTTVGPGAQILSHSVLEGARVGAGARVGPFARLRPGAVMGAQAAAGNFVEVKNATIGAGSKVSHLSYVGDASIGEQANIGAGTIFCNYDGANKFKTTVKDRAFIGSGSELVAPVTIGEGATVGAGTTVTKDVPDNTLCIRRAKQQCIEGWQRPTKEKDETKD